MTCTNCLCKMEVEITDRTVKSDSAKSEAKAVKTNGDVGEDTPTKDGAGDSSCNDVAADSDSALSGTDKSKAEKDLSGGKENGKDVTEDAETEKKSEDVETEKKSEDVETEKKSPLSEATSSSKTDTETKTKDEPKAADAPADEDKECVVVEVPKPEAEVIDLSADEKKSGEKKENTTESEEKDASSASDAPEEKDTKKDPSEKKKKSEVTIEASPVPRKEDTPLQKYWKAVRNNPTDFTGWTYLLQYVEQEGTVDEGREAFNTFLARYPYCYGYWKKYADLEKKHGDLDVAEEVYERGLRAIPLSIDLWSHYITFYYNKVDEKDPQRSQKIRKLYERAISAAGTDFRSDKLWESYICWEHDNQHPAKVTSLYDRLLGIPTYLYSHHFDKFTQHVKAHKPMELLSLDEFLKLRMEHVKSKTPQATEGALPGEDDDADGPPGTEAPPGMDVDAPPGEEAPPGAEDSQKKDDDEDDVLREKIIELRRLIHKRNEEEVSRRWSYEEGIRRPYFHVKPLERVQLKNWREYLEFEIESGPHERVVVLFERCMIACALYEEFWLKYAKYLEEFNTEGVHNVYERACTIHLPKKPVLHMHWAAFEERQGNVHLAKKILDEIEEQVSGLAMVTLRKISLERRQCNFNCVEDLYNKHLDSPKKEIRSFYAIKYARYLTKIIGNRDRAEKILKDAIEDDPLNYKLYLQLLDTEYQKPRLQEGEMTKIFNSAIQSDMDVEHRLMFSQRKLEFLEDFGSNIKRIMEAYEEHQKLMKENQSKKRKAQEKDDSSSNKKAKVDPNSSSSRSSNNMAAASQQSQVQQHTAAAMDPNAAAWQQWMSAYGNYNSYQQQGSWAGYGQQQGWGGYNH